jgi:hypothetical protein
MIRSTRVGSARGIPYTCLLALMPRTPLHYVEYSWRYFRWSAYISCSVGGSRGSGQHTSRARAHRVQSKGGRETPIWVAVLSLREAGCSRRKGGRETPSARCAGALRDSSALSGSVAENLRSNLVSAHAGPVHTVYAAMASAAVRGADVRALAVTADGRKDAPLGIDAHQRAVLEILSSAACTRRCGCLQDLRCTGQTPSAGAPMPIRARLTEPAPTVFAMRKHSLAFLLAYCKSTRPGAVPLPLQRHNLNLLGVARDLELAAVLVPGRERDDAAGLGGDLSYLVTLHNASIRHGCSFRYGIRKITGSYLQFELSD